MQHEKTEYKLMVYAIATFVGHLIIVLEQVNKYIVPEKHCIILPENV